MFPELSEKFDAFLWDHRWDQGRSLTALGVRGLRYLYALIRDFFSGQLTLRAMSLVPDAVRCLNEQSRAYYMPVADVADPSTNGGKTLTRQQIELVAGRVSLLNECFY